MYLRSNFQNTEHALGSIDYSYCPDQNMNFEKNTRETKGLNSKGENNHPSLALVIRQLSLHSWTLALPRS